MADSKDAILENMYDNEKAFSSAIFQQAVNVNRAILLTGGGEGMVRNIFLGDGLACNFYCRDLCLHISCCGLRISAYFLLWACPAFEFPATFIRAIIPATL